MIKKNPQKIELIKNDIHRYKSAPEFLGNSNRLLFRRLETLLRLGIRTASEVFHVVDDGDEERTARATSDLFAHSELILGNLKEVSARAWVGEGLKLLVPLHVFDLHIVVRHRFEIAWGYRRFALENFTFLGVCVRVFFKENQLGFIC